MSSPTFIPLPPRRRPRNMSLTQTYFLAHTARGKLSHEAAQADHNLRYLVGHANLLDSLMLDLAQAEQEQESWFDSAVAAADAPSPKPTPALTSTTQHKPAPRHIQWADTVNKEEDEDEYYEDSSDDSDSEDDEEQDITSAPRPTHTFTNMPTLFEAEEEEEEHEDDMEEDYAALTLQRSPSHSQQPPALSHDHSDDDSSDDELAMPPSPPNTALPSFSSRKQPIDYYDMALTPDQQADFLDQGFYLPTRSPGLVSAVSVY